MRYNWQAPLLGFGIVLLVASFAIKDTDFFAVGRFVFGVGMILTSGCEL